MEEEKKEISRKTLIGIIVALIIIVVIAFGIIIYFVSSNNKEIGKDTSSETTLDDNEIINKIYTVLDNVNNKYDLGFNVNTEQMNEIIDFYKSTNNFNEESLFNFIGEKGWAIKGSGEIDNSQVENQSSNFSESDIRKFVEQRYYKYNDENYDIIDKIEKYDEDGTGKYIYIVYSQRYITVNGNFHYKDCVDVCSVDTTQSSEPQVELTSIGSSSALDSAIERMKSEINWNTSGNSTSSSTLNYKSDDELKVLAFKKWLEKDEYISLQYNYGNNSSCFYTGNITKNADGSVSVHLKLYPDKKIYEDAIKYTGSTDGVGALGSATIKLTKVEATR